MKGGLNLFGRGKDMREGSSFFLLIFILSSLIIGSISISGCNCSEDVGDATEIDGGRRDVVDVTDVTSGGDVIIVDGETEDIVDVRDAVFDVGESTDIVAEDTEAEDATMEDISNLDGGSEDVPQIIDGGTEDTGDGGEVWNYLPKTYGGGWWEEVHSIQQTRDGGYIVAGYTGSFGAGNGDFLVLKLKSNGDIEWQRSYGGGGHDDAYSVRQTTDGGYIVAGKTLSFGAGKYDMWVLKLKSNGDIEWQRSYGGGYDDVAYSIEQTRDGGYIVAGRTNSFDGNNLGNFWVLKLNGGGEVEWQRSYGEGQNGATSIQQTRDGGYIVAGWTYYFKLGENKYYDFWVLKLKSNGDIEWQRRYGGRTYNYAYSIQETTDGGYIVAGSTRSSRAGNYDFWVLKLRNNGDIEWQRSYGGGYDDVAYSIQETRDDGYIVAGYTYSFGAGYDDFWVLKLRSNGDIEWQRSYGGSNDERAYSVQQTTDGGYIVGGKTLSFGASNGDFWVLKLNSDGSVEGSCKPEIGAITNATVNITSASPSDTSNTANPTSGAEGITSATMQDTNATVNMQCTAP